MLFQTAVRFPWILALVAPLFLAACGDDDGDEDTADTGADIQSSPDTPDSTPPDQTGDIPGIDTLVGTDSYVPCAPDCTQKLCGPDGCGGVCGECFVGEECSVDWRCVSLAGKRAFGEACGATQNCETIINTQMGATPNPDYPTCLNDQCASGLCDTVSCTRACAFVADDINNTTLEPTPDGIEDPEHNSCAGANIDGPYSAHYRCVNTAPEGFPPDTRCAPGDPLSPCNSDKDCEPTESCTIVTVLGASETRCTHRVKDGKSVGATCNSGAADWPMGLCASPSLCASEGCTALCTTDAECPTAAAQCDQGQCNNNPAQLCETDTDCSAWRCETVDPKIAPDSLIKGLCTPKSCNNDTTCTDPNFYCKMGVEIADDGLAAWAHECREKTTTNNATVGDVCTNDPKDGIICDNPDLCYKGQCSTLCQSDTDCNKDAGQVCAIAEIPFDVDADNKTDILLPLSLCEGVPHEGPLVECISNTDCTTEGEVCAPIEIPASTGPYPYIIQRHCRKPHPDFGKYGDVCGLAPGEGECAIGFCTIDDQNTAKTMCSQTCDTRYDCPEIKVDTITRPSICRSVRLGANNSFAPEDDLYVPICWPVAPESSRDDCSQDFVCDDPAEACLPWAIATGPIEPGKVEFVCLRGLGPTPAKGKGKTGDECTADADCETLMCIDDLGGKKICTALCKNDSECLAGGPFMVCDNHVLVPRPNPKQSLTIPQCRKAQTCIGCTEHTDCADGMKCVRANVAKTDYVCAHPCTTNDDCTKTDGGTLCKSAKGANGPSDIFKACAPSTCP